MLRRVEFGDDAIVVNVEARALSGRKRRLGDGGGGCGGRSRGGGRLGLRVRSPAPRARSVLRRTGDGENGRQQHDRQKRVVKNSLHRLIILLKNDTPMRALLTTPARTAAASDAGTAMRRVERFGRLLQYDKRFDVTSCI